MRLPYRAITERVAALSDHTKLDHARQTAMLWTCVMMLLTVWLLGVATSTRAGGLIHLALAAAAVLVGLLWVRQAPIRPL